MDEEVKFTWNGMVYRISSVDQLTDHDVVLHIIDENDKNDCILITEYYDNIKKGIIEVK